MKALLVAGIALFQAFKDLPSILSKIGALLGWGGFWAGSLGGASSYFLDGPYTIQLISGGTFACIAGVYFTLTWARLWEQKRPGVTPGRNVRASDNLSHPEAPPKASCPELLVVERWLSVIKELNEDAEELREMQSEVEQIDCSVNEADKEPCNLSSPPQCRYVSKRSHSPNHLRAVIEGWQPFARRNLYARRCFQRLP